MIRWPRRLQEIKLGPPPLPSRRAAEPFPALQPFALYTHVLAPTTYLSLHGHITPVFQCDIVE